MPNSTRVQNDISLINRLGNNSNFLFNRARN